MYCTNCGERVDDNASFCVKCGTPVYTEMSTEKNNVSDVYYNSRTVKYRRSGAATASLVLGIIAIIFTLFTFIGSIGMAVYAEKTLEVKVYSKLSSSFDAEKMMIALGLSLLPSILAIIGLCLAIGSRGKVKNGANGAGIILNTITIIALIVQTIIVMTI